jgi:hypothetical protein
MLPFPMLLSGLETLLFLMHNGLLRISKDDVVELFAVYSIVHYHSLYVSQLIVARLDGLLEDTFYIQCNEAARGYRLDSLYHTHLGLVAGLLRYARGMQGAQYETTHSRSRDIRTVKRTTV